MVARLKGDGNFSATYGDVTIEANPIQKNITISSNGVSASVDISTGAISGGLAGVEVSLNGDGSVDVSYSKGPVKVSQHIDPNGHSEFSGEVKGEIGGVSASEKITLEANPSGGLDVGWKGEVAFNGIPVFENGGASHIGVDDVADMFGGMIGNAIAAIRNRNAQLREIENGISPSTNAPYIAARSFALRRDPLALDLDGDGLETTGITATTQILFDHDGDGIKTGTGWVKGDDAFLALDRNGNGSIDSGNELFGVDTVMSNGLKAANGFAALADLDSNKDGKFSSLDSQFAKVRVWRDLDLDGVSDVGELQTLAEAGITSINLNSSASSTNLGNGNIMSAAATFTKANGTTGTLGEFTTGTTGNLDLVSNPFYREFTDHIPLTADAAKLPGLQGSGAVRDLQEAASLNAALVTDVNSLAGTTRSQMMAKLDTLLQDWANSSSMQTSEQKVAAMGLKPNGDYPHILFNVPGITSLELATLALEYSSPGHAQILVNKATAGFDANHYAAMKVEVERFSKMVSVLEKFNGMTFFDFPTTDGVSLPNGQSFKLVPGGSTGASAGVAENVFIMPTLTAQQIELLYQSYDALKQSAYEGLVLQTRLKGYLDAISLNVDQTGINFDFSGMNTAIESKHAADPVNGLVDLIDLSKLLGGAAGLSAWSAEPNLSNWMAQAAKDGTWEAVRSAFFSKTFTGAPNTSAGDDFYLAPAGDTSFGAGAGNDFVMGGAGNDSLSGDDGDDMLYGGTGNDTLYGGNGEDILDGGAGNDTYWESYGNDTYLFGRGDGWDLIKQNYSSDGTADTIRFKAGVSAADVSMYRSMAEGSGYDLVLTINGTTDSIRVQNWVNNTAVRVERIEFADGTVWDTSMMLKAPLLGTEAADSMVAALTSGDVLRGFGGDDTMYGSSGNDLLEGGSGNDTLYGGNGEDILDGGAGNDTYWESYGNDTYLFGRGDGWDLIKQNYSSDGTADTIRFKAGVSAADVSMYRSMAEGSGYDLVLTINGTTDSIRVQNWVNNTAVRVERIEFADGTVWDTSMMLKAPLLGTEAADSMVAALTSGDVLRGFGGDDTMYGSSGNDLLEGGSGNDTLYGGNGEDILDGGAGNDTYWESYGNDTYLFGRGDGWDLIKQNYSSDGTADTIRFKAGVSAADVSMYRSMAEGSGYDLVLTINGTTDSIRVQNWVNNTAVRVERIEFADGTVWDTSMMLKAPLLGTEAADSMVAALTSGDVLRGFGGDDTMYGSSGNDLLEGGSGNDTLYGGNGQDILDGGAGNDTYWESYGNDTYLFGRGDGWDLIKQNYSSDGTADTIRFKAGVSAADVSMYRSMAEGSGYDLVLTINGTTDSIRVQNWVNNTAVRVERIEFADGTVWDTSMMLKAPLLGTEAADSMVAALTSGDVLRGFGGDDTMYGSSGNDLLEGGSGNDTLYGGNGEDILDGGAGNDTYWESYGNDTYLFGRGDGWDLIKQNYSSDGTADTIRFKAGVSAADVSMYRSMAEGSGYDLVLTINGTTDSIRVQNWVNNTAVRVERIEFADGTVWDTSMMLKAPLLGTEAADSMVAALTSGDVLRGFGGDDTMYGSSGNDLLEGGSGNDTLYGGNGEDILDGGAGNDTYWESYGNDTYLFGRGDGWDLIKQNYSSDGTADTIRFKAGVSAADVSMYRSMAEGSGYDLVLTINGTTDSIRVQNWVNNTAVRVERIEFADGTVWDTSMMLKAPLLGTEAADSMVAALTSGDVLRGFGGDDTMYGSSGNDLLEGGSGNDTLYGGNGEDILDGGAGNDTYWESYGNDTYLFGRGDGWDLIKQNYSSDGTADTIRFKAGVSAADVSMYRSMAEGSGYDLVLTINGTTDSIRVQNWVNNTAVRVERIEFADGTVWDTSMMLKAPLLTQAPVLGTDNADVMQGTTGNDWLNGLGGADTMKGGAGNDVYVVDNPSDIVFENANEGIDEVRSSISYTLTSTLENLTLIGAAAINGTGTSADNILTGNSAANTLVGLSGNDTLDGCAGGDTLIGGTGNDTYVVDNADDLIIENSSEGADTVQSSISYTLGSGLENLILTGYSAINGIGNALDNVLTGNNYANMLTGGAGNDTLNGGVGNDILEGGDGNDILTDTSGNGFFNGGAGADTITGGAGSEIILGGLGNDTYNTGAGNDIILFNKGDGQDTFAAGGSGSDVVSLGGGIGYADLSFSKSANDLVLKISATDQITFKDWYAATPSKSVAKLQVMAEAMAGFVQGGSDPLKNQKVENFDFAGLVGAFDTARAANTGLTSWALTNALGSFQLAGSDTAALGGDLAYQYGKNGTLAGIGVTPALTTLSDVNLGTTAQTLTPLTGLQTGSARLS